MATIAELRARKATLPTREIRVCLDHEVLADVQRLTTERNDLQAEAAQAKESGTARSRKMSQGENPRLTEIAAELEALWGRMRESEDTLRLRAMPAGEWLRFVEENPARSDSEPGHDVDQMLCMGLCSTAAVYDSLDRFAVQWNDEEIGASDWEAIAAQISPRDLQEIVRLVVLMHQEHVVAPPKSQSGSATSRSSATA